MNEGRCHQASPGVDVLGPGVWCGGDSEPATCGVALGVPIGHAEYIQSTQDARLEEKCRLMKNCSLICKVRGCWRFPAPAHVRNGCCMGTVLTHSATYAAGHDAGKASWATLQHLIAYIPRAQRTEWDVLPHVAFLRGAQLLAACIGLASAEQIVPAAYIGQFGQTQCRRAPGNCCRDARMQHDDVPVNSLLALCRLHLARRVDMLSCGIPAAQCI